MASESPSGINLVHLTMDTEEHSRRFIKKLLAKKLIAEAEVEDGGFTRHFMKLG